MLPRRLGNRRYVKLLSENESPTKPHSKKSQTQADWRLIQAIYEKNQEEVFAARRDGANPDASLKVSILVTCQPDAHRAFLPAHHLILDTCEVPNDSSPPLFEVTLTPLYLAVQNRDANLAQWLVINGARCDQLHQPFSLNAASHPDTTLPAQETPLHTAIRLNDTPCLAALLSDPDCLNTQDSNGNTPLHLAIHLGQTHLVKILLEAHASIRSRDNDENTPLHLAVLQNDKVSAQLIITHGLQHDHQRFKKDFIDLTNANDATPLMLAVSTQNLPLISALLDAHASTKGISLNTAIRVGANDLVDALFTQSSAKKITKSLATPNAEGLTPLEVAIQTENGALVAKFLRHGAVVTDKERALAESIHNEEIGALLDRPALPECHLSKSKRGHFRLFSKSQKKPDDADMPLTHSLSLGSSQ